MKLNNKNNSYNNQIVNIKKNVSKKIVIIGGVIIMSLSCILLPGCVQGDETTLQTDSSGQVIEDDSLILRPMPIMPIGYPWIYEFSAELATKIMTKILK